MRWLLASNRLPFDVNKKSGAIVKGSGGLVTALSGMGSNIEKLWFGIETDGESAKILRTQASKVGYKEIVPVMVNPEEYDLYYNQFSNDALWPILHYQSDLVKFKGAAWEAYKRVNETIADAICKKARKSDLVWVHDFHFFLVPKLIKKARPELKVGFFLHVPFPSSEVFRELPKRDELLKGVMGADLVGFHEYSYLRHFASTLQVVMGYDYDLFSIRKNSSSSSSSTRLGVFPASVDTRRLLKARQSPAVKKQLSHYLEKKGSQLQVLGVDRLDYSKGLELKLHIFERLLEAHPELVGKVKLIQVAVPTRQNVLEYQKLRLRIEGLVGQINGRFGRPHNVPVEYIFSSVSFDELMALYQSSEALLVTSTRDGMNLVAKEYLVAQLDNDPGSVVLSEFAGAVSTLPYATSINPWDTDESAARLFDVLKMPLKERKHRHEKTLEFLKTYDSRRWAKTFGEAMLSDEQEEARVLELNPQSKTWGLPLRVISELKEKPLVLVFDYDGTLVPIANKPEAAILPEETASLLKKLQKSKKACSVIVSGRDSEFLLEQFSGFGLYLAAEHGAQVYDPKKKTWKSAPSSRNTRWYKMAHKLMQEFSVRVPNSFVELKDNGLAWHYRDSPRDFARFEANRLKGDLGAGLGSFPVSIIDGKKIIEVRSLEANKGYFLEDFLISVPKKKGAKVIVMGDDRTDEDMFEVANNSGLSIKVGQGATSASYRIPEQSHVDAFLKFLESFC